MSECMYKYIIFALTSFNRPLNAKMKREVDLLLASATFSTLTFLRRLFFTLSLSSLQNENARRHIAEARDDLVSTRTRFLDLSPALHFVRICNSYAAFEFVTKTKALWLICIHSNGNFGVGYDSFVV